MSVPKSHHGYSPTATGNNSQAAASNSNMRWLQAPDVNLRNLSRTESDVSLALHDTNRSGRRWRRVGLATAIATLRGSRNASRKRLDEVSRVRLPESADPNCLWNRSLLLGQRAFDRHRQLPSFLHSATIFLQIAYSLESSGAPLGHCWPACSAWRQPSRARHAVRSSLVRRCFEEARCLNESAIGAKAAEAAPLHEGPAILVVHRPEEESLVVMLEKAVVSEVCARELLLRLRDADHEFLLTMGLRRRIRVQNI